jgi:hypothetical protein
MNDKDDLELKQDPEPEPKSDDKKEPEKVIPYDRFKEVNDENKELKDRLTAIEQKQKEAEDKALKEKEDYKTLFEQKEAELKNRDKELLRLRVAQKKGLPADLANRLMGDTEQELEEDADKLLEFVKQDTPPGVPPRKLGGGSTRLDIRNMTLDEIRENKTKLLEQERLGKQS